MYTVYINLDPRLKFELEGKNGGQNQKINLNAFQSKLFTRFFNFPLKKKLLDMQKKSQIPYTFFLFQSENIKTKPTLLPNSALLCYTAVTIFFTRSILRTLCEK